MHDEGLYAPLSNTASEESPSAMWLLGCKPKGTGALALLLKISVPSA